MGARPRFDWAAIRSEYSVGVSQTELSKKYNVSRKAISKHVEKEGWTRDLRQAVIQQAHAKVAGIESPRDPDKVAQAIQEESSRVAGIIRRHREEWTHVGVLHNQSVAESQLRGPDGRTQLNKRGLDSAYKTARLAKILAEETRMRQEGERLAWAIDKPVSPADSISDADLEAAIEETSKAIATARGKHPA